jgi:hypothetical protein
MQAHILVIFFLFSSLSPKNQSRLSAKNNSYGRQNGQKNIYENKIIQAHLSNIMYIHKMKKTLAAKRLIVMRIFFEKSIHL